ncbi:hypothetical protein NIES3974_30370 [Calothrix sp. NIES-3974]|nr:hypothetical protein NIES3974_30370 [Calothrix sp. NIES-3974]
MDEVTLNLNFQNHGFTGIVAFIIRRIYFNTVRLMIFRGGFRRRDISRLYNYLGFINLLIRTVLSLLPVGFMKNIGQYF